MERLVIKPRENYQTIVEELGLSYHTDNGRIYWDERVCYRFTADEIAEIESATNELEKLCMELVDNVIRNQRYNELNIPECAWGLIASSWQRRDRSLFGRFDLSYDCRQPPKLLEYNADGAGSLLEASVIQSHWRDQMRPGFGQFNRIQESLLAAWSSFGPGPVHMPYLDGGVREDIADTNFMAEIVRQAGLDTIRESTGEIYWNGQAYVDSENAVIKSLYKCHHWEQLIEEWCCEKIQQASMQFIEPAWKMILNNKNMMVLLWEMFPHHPNLLPAFFDHKYLRGDYVQKPIYGVRGQNVSLYSKKGNFLAEGEYDFSDGPYMYQQHHPLLKIAGNYSIIGSWVVAGEAAGIGVREDVIPIMNDDSRFIPHYIE